MKMYINGSWVDRADTIPVLAPFDQSVIDTVPRATGADLQCSAGQVSLKLPQDAAGTFDLSCDVGNVDVADRYGLTVRRSVTSASARGTVGNADATYTLHSTVGQVVLR